jgi:hypothetical protein
MVDPISAPNTPKNRGFLIMPFGRNEKRDWLTHYFLSRGHHRNHQGLRDRLIETDGNWPVQVSNKLVSRHLGHCHKDSLVERGFANLGSPSRSQSYLIASRPFSIDRPRW